MKNIILLILFLPLTSLSQVNYAELAEELNNKLKQEVERRENLKRHYNDLFIISKDELLNSDFFTNDATIDNMIFQIQRLYVDYAKNLNSSLRAGVLNPSKYEREIKSLPSQYRNSTNNLRNLYNNKLMQSNTIENYDKQFNKAASHISGFYLTAQGSPMFSVSGLIYKGNRTLIGLLSFFNEFATDINIYNNSIIKFRVAEEIRIKAEEVKRKIAEEKIKKINLYNENIYNEILDFIKRRDDKTSKLNNKDLKTFFKQEIKYLKIKGWKNHIKWHLGKRKIISKADILTLTNRLSVKEKFDYQTNYAFIEDLISFCDCR